MKLDRKQKVLITLIVIALAFLAWQLYDMFFAGEEQPAPTQATPATTQLQPITPSAPAQPAIPTIAPTATTTTTQTVAPQIVATPAPTTTTAVVTQPTPVITTPQSQTIMPSVAPQQTLAPTTPATPVTLPSSQPQIRQMPLTMPISATQAEYLRLVNRYQIVRMKRLVVDEEAAIAQSQEKIAQLDQQITKIGGQTSPNISSITSSVSITGYQLMYVDNQGGQWTATLSKAGRFIEVTSGRTLADGTRIMRIDENGVVILQNGNYYLLNFYGTTHLTHFYTPPPPPKRIFIAKPMPKPVIIKSISTPTPRVKIIPWRKEVPQRCVGNSPNCAPKTTVAMNTASPPVTTTAEKQLVSQPSSITKNVMLLQTQPTQSPVLQSPIATANAAPAPKTILAENNSPPPQPSPLLQPRPPATLPLKPKQDLLALTPEQKTKVVQIENSTPTKPAIFNIDSYSTDEKHLLASPGNYYTLQLIGNNSLSTLTDFIKTHKLNAAYTYHTFYLNKDWFILIYGIFQTQQNALNAIKALPPAAQKLKPWVRTLASVQEAIKLAPANK